MYKCYHKLRSKTNAHAVICLAVMVILTVEERIQQEIYIYIFFFSEFGGNCQSQFCFSPLISA